MAAGPVPLPPMSVSRCLPGRGGLELWDEQGQQVQRGFIGCPLGHFCHGDLPREQESPGDCKAWEGRRGCFWAPEENFNLQTRLPQNSHPYTFPILV